VATVSQSTTGFSFSRALIAGLIGAVLVDAFYIPVNHLPFVGTYEFIASGWVGAAAYTSQAYMWLGLATHLLVSIVWAMLYMVVWPRVGSLSNWIVGGVAWGLVVYLAMDGLMLARGIFGPQTVQSVLISVIAHIAFFGIPVAFYLSREPRSA